MKKVEITLHIEPEEFVIKNIKPISQKNMLLMNLKNEVKGDEKTSI